MAVYTPYNLTIENDPYSNFEPLPAQHRTLLSDIYCILADAIDGIEAGELYCGSQTSLFAAATALRAELLAAHQERDEQARMQERRAEVAATYSDGPRYSIGATPVGKRL